MRVFITLLLSLVMALSASAVERRDTLRTPLGGDVILRYDIRSGDNNITITLLDGRITNLSPSARLREYCKDDVRKLKVVMFDKVGSYGDVTMNLADGLKTIRSFSVPAGVKFQPGDDGYYIFGEAESTPLSFTLTTGGVNSIEVPIYIALYEKKKRYKLLCQTTRPWTVKLQPQAASRTVGSRTRTEQIPIQSVEELEADNDADIKALDAIKRLRDLLEMADSYPFGQVLELQMLELSKLRSETKNPDISERINEVMDAYQEKVKELKAAQQNAEMQAKAEEQALLAQQKAEEQERQREAEEKARQQEEKQQKRTIWMIIGGAILAVLSFIGNAVFKHFRDVRNQKSIMQMQESLVKQAEYEATRRTREIVRNKAHQVANKGRNKMRETINNSKKGKDSSTEEKPQKPTSNETKKKNPSNNQKRRTI